MALIQPLSGVIMKRLLIIDDDIVFSQMTASILKEKGWEVFLTTTSKDFFIELNTNEYSVALVDLQIKTESGIDVVKKTETEYPDLPVFMCTAHGSIQTAVEAMKNGALDYFSKPLNYDELLIKLNKAHQQERTNQEFVILKRKYKESILFRDIIGKSQSMLEMIELVKPALNLDVTILINGETGTGKELLSKAIHYESDRKDKPFVVVNCATLDENLLASELFGHEKGSFTGANVKKSGKFEIVEDGTLFLDEIGEIPPSIQKRLLRVLQENEFEKVGSNKVQKTSCRIIAATNKNLEEMVKASDFREDLFFRLNVFPVQIPSLRKRKKDIPSLIKNFVSTSCEKFKKEPLTVTDEFITQVQSKSFPGNVRELEHFIQRCVILSKGLEIQNIDKKLSVNLSEDDWNMPYNDFIKNCDKYYFKNVIAKYEGRAQKAADFCGVTRKTIYQKINAYGLKDKI